jgi:NADH-quinone oxidoreductase subunit K
VSDLLATAGAGVVPVLAAVPPHRLLYLAAALFAVGLVGVTCRRNVLIILLSVEILLNAANVAFVAFSRIHGEIAGQTFVFFAMTIAAAEVAVGLAIVIAVYRLRHGVDADAAGSLKERNLGEVPPITPEGPDTPHAADHGHGGPDDGSHGAAHDPHGAHDAHGGHAAAAEAHR